MTKNKGRGKEKGGMDQIVCIPFRVRGSTALPTSVTTTFTEIDLTLANLGTRAVAIGSTFEYFRIKNVSAYTYVDLSGTAYDSDVTGGVGLQGNLVVIQALAFIESNAALTGTATSLTQMSQYELYKEGGPYEKLRMRVSGRLLRDNAFKWFNCASTGASTDDLSNGMFIYAASNGVSIVSGWNGNVNIVIEGVIEFRGMITPALSFSGAETLMNYSQPSSSQDDEKSESAVMVGSASDARTSSVRLPKHPPDSILIDSVRYERKV